MTEAARKAKLSRRDVLIDLYFACAQHRTHKISIHDLHLMVWHFVNGASELGIIISPEFVFHKGHFCYSREITHDAFFIMEEHAIDKTRLHLMENKKWKELFPAAFEPTVQSIALDSYQKTINPDRQNSHNKP